MARNKKKKLDQLARITDLAFQIAQADLRRKTEAENRHQAALIKLDQDREHVLEALQLDDETTAAQIVGNSRWLIWAERQRAMKTMELARARAASLSHKEAAKRAFGRSQVAQRLRKKEE